MFIVETVEAGVGGDPKLFNMIRSRSSLNVLIKLSTSTLHCATEQHDSIETDRSSCVTSDRASVAVDTVDDQAAGCAAFTSIGA
jgi:hypothetical protein